MINNSNNKYKLEYYTIKIKAKKSKLKNKKTKKNHNDYYLVICIILYILFSKKFS